MFEASYGFLPIHVCLLLPTLFPQRLLRKLWNVSLVFFIVYYTCGSWNNNIFSFDFYNLYLCFLQFRLVLFNMFSYFSLWLCVTMFIHSILILHTILLYKYTIFYQVCGQWTFVLFSDPSLPFFFSPIKNNSSGSILRPTSRCKCARIPLNNGTAGSCTRRILLYPYCQSVSWSGSTNLYSHQRCGSSCALPHPQPLVWSNFLILIYMEDVKGHLIIISIFISLPTNEINFLFLC